MVAEREWRRIRTGNYHISFFCFRGWLEAIGESPLMIADFRSHYIGSEMRVVSRVMEIRSGGT